jgi:hypothetical protein
MVRKVSHNINQKKQIQAFPFTSFPTSCKNCEEPIHTHTQRERERERSTLERGSEVGEREELVEGSKFGEGVAHLSLFLHRRFLLGRWALSLGGGGFRGGRRGTLILRTRRIFRRVGL